MRKKGVIVMEQRSTDSTSSSTTAVAAMPLDVHPSIVLTHGRSTVNVLARVRLKDPPTMPVNNQSAMCA